VYLYSTADDPGIENSLSSSRSSPSPLRSPNPKRRNLDKTIDIKMAPLQEENGMDVDEQPAASMRDLGTLNADGDQDRDSEDSHDDDSDHEGYLEFADSSEVDEESFLPHVPVILPRRRFAGARNVATIKDGGPNLLRSLSKLANRLVAIVNFLGPDDEYVASGSDDGNFFIWDKATAAVRGIYEGDSSVVNMVEGHPHLPLVAVSGIDTTVKVVRPPLRWSTELTYFLSCLHLLMDPANFQGWKMLTKSWRQTDVQAEAE
jgi:WD repeat-containing protein 42A